MLDQIRQEISNLLLQYPELADDDILRADMVEAETKAYDFLHTLENKRQAGLILIMGLKALIEQLRQRLARIERHEEGLRGAMRKTMEAADLKKVTLPEATITLRLGPPHVLITDETKIEDYYWRVKWEPNKTLIGAALKAGQVVEGAVLSNPEPVLTIKVT
jgi:hypothetical protein